jgi:hypothetical protein
MVEIGRKYKTKDGKNVIIERHVKYEDCTIFKGNNTYDYNEKGEAFFVLMFKGRFRSEKNDIIIE